MTIDFKYIADDFAEANKAKLAAMNPKKGKGAPKTKPVRRWISSWAVFAFLAVMFFVFLDKLHWMSRAMKGSIAAEPDPTHNFLQTLAVSIAAPLFLTAFVFLVLSGNERARSVPFYTAKWPGTSLSQKFWRITALVCGLLGVGALVAVFRSPTAPNWRPQGIDLLFVMFGPWIIWLFLMSALAKWQVALAKKREGGKLLAVGGSSLFETQRLEVSDEGVTVSNPLVASRFAWAYFVSYLESENLLTLYTRDLGMQIVPRRAFAEPGSFERFCGLVQTHVAAGQFLPRQSGFAVLAPVPALPIDAK